MDEFRDIIFKVICIIDILFVAVFVILVLLPNRCSECNGKNLMSVPFQKTYSDGHSKWDSAIRCEDCGYERYPL